MGLNHKVIFGMKLRQFREQAGLSLTDLGARIRLSTSYLTEIEHGKKYRYAVSAIDAKGNESQKSPVAEVTF